MAYSLVSSISVAGASDTPSHSFSGCQLITAYVTYDSSATFGDSQSNTWTPLAEDTPNGLNTYGRWYYVYGPSTSGSQTFGLSISYGAICVLGWTNAANPPFDVQTATGKVGTGVTSIDTGTIQPTTNDDLLLFGISTGLSTSSMAIDSGFTIPESQDAVSDVNYGASVAYYLQTTAADVTALWTWSGAATVVSRGAAFKSTGGPPPSGGQPMMRRWGGRSGPVPGIGQSSGGGKAWG